MVLWSNGSLTVNTSGYITTKADTGRSDGKWYWELYASRADLAIVGIANESVPLTGSNFLNTGARWYYANSGEKTPPRSAYASSYATGDTIGIFLDLDNGTITFYKNGISQGVAFTDVKLLGEVFPAVSRGSSSGTHEWIANFGASEFSFLPEDLPNGTKSYDGSKTLVSINKSFIFHDNNYKRWIERGMANTASSSSIPVMTSNTAPSGEAKSSGVLANDSRYLPYKAFNGVNNQPDNAWVSNSTTNSWISYTFPTPLKIGRVDIAPYSSAVNSAPKNIRIEGSNDGVNYKELAKFSNLTNWSTGNYMIFTFYNSEEYNEYRIFVIDNNGNTNYISISDIKMYVKLEDDVINSTWENVTSSTPSLIQFTEKGMDSLPPLFERKVTTLVPIKMELDNGFNGVGKIFRKKVDLNKYLNLNSITTEKRDSE